MTCCRLLFLVTLIGAIPALAEDAPRSSEFSDAKKSYEAESGKIHTLIRQSLEKRAAAAQKSGQTSLATAIASEKKAFEEYGEVPPGTPVAQIRKLAVLAKLLDEAYTKEVKSLTKANQTAPAEAMEKEQIAFRRKLSIQGTRSTLLGKWHLNMAAPGLQLRHYFFSGWDHFSFHREFSRTLARGSGELPGDVRWRRIGHWRCCQFAPRPRRLQGHNINGHGFTLKKIK